MRRHLIAAALACATATGLAAQDVRITTFKADSTFTLNGRTFTISRDQDTDARLTGDFARTARACPSACVQPMVAAPGVATFGELELLSFLETTLNDGTGLLIDARAPAAFTAGTIPGAVNVPAPTLAAENRFRDDILRALGAVDGAGGTLDFTAARSLALFSGGPWSPDARAAVVDLIDAGYPADRLFFYRGGMQAWIGLGLTVHSPVNPG